MVTMMIPDKADYTKEDIKQMYENDHEQLVNLLADTSLRDDNGKQAIMGQAELSPQNRCTL